MKCWCGRSLSGDRCGQAHDLYATYLCSCGLHLFNTKQSTSPSAWVRHQAHMAEFRVRVQARVDAAIAFDVPVSWETVTELIASERDAIVADAPVPAVTDVSRKIERRRQHQRCEVAGCGQTPGSPYGVGVRCEGHRP